MSYQPIENYGIIGNQRPVAPLGMKGSIDWYCYPHFDSPSIFGAILDDDEEGAVAHFQASSSVALFSDRRNGERGTAGNLSLPRHLTPGGGDRPPWR